MINDPEQVVAACKRKDQKAMKLLYEELAPVMMGVCMRYARSREDAQDLLHDGFVKVFERIGQLRNAQALVRWVYKIMLSVSVNYVLESQILVYCDLEENDEQNSFGELEQWDFDRVTTAEMIVEILQTLPEPYRLAFNMREVEEMEYKDISEQMKVTETTARTYVHRAKNMIRERLGVCAESSPLDRQTINEDII